MYYVHIQLNLVLLLSNNTTQLYHSMFHTDFEITVYTGTKRLAGTDANVYVTFQGTERTSSKIKLVSDHNNQSLFQRGSVDKFHVRFNDIGEILTMRFA